VQPGHIIPANANAPPRQLPQQLGTLRLVAQLAIEGQIRIARSLARHLRQRLPFAFDADAGGVPVGFWQVRSAEPGFGQTLAALGIVAERFGKERLMDILAGFRVGGYGRCLLDGFLGRHDWHPGRNDSQRQYRKRQEGPPHDPPLLLDWPQRPRSASAR
jgi:hypothetical protein